MVEEVRRQVVSDPLAQQARGQTPDRSLPLAGIRNPGQSSGDGYFREALNGLAALGSVQKAVADVFAAKQDEWVAKGKMDYMTGVSEEEVLRTGNKYTQRGYEALSSVDQASGWYQNELLAIDETTRDMDPEAYKSYLMQKRKDALSNLPNDPAIRKVYVAAFEEYGPRLAAEQFKAHNELNRTKNINALSGAAYSSAGANEDASRVMPGGPLRVSPGVVSPAIEFSAEDRDVGIRTMLGEAGGEGELGMAAVAHVLKNRAIDGRYGGTSIKGVALAKKQFSAWNDGPGGIRAIRAYSPDSKAYQRAAKVYDAVMHGHHADPTGGATHYYSPIGMDVLVRQGSQKNRVPGWWAAQSAHGSVTIGNHRFAGKARGLENFIGRAPLDGPGQAELDYFGPQDEYAGDTNYKLTPHQREREYDPRGQQAAQLTPVQGTTQIRATFDASNLRDEDKAVAAADAMIRALEEGSDQVYNDLGGEGYLRELGAGAAVINAVQAAKAKQTKAQQDRFDVDSTRKVEDFKSAVRSGHFPDQTALLEAVDALQEDLGQDEAWATSLAKETLTDWHKATEDDRALHPQMAADLAGIQRMLTEEPNYTAEQASKDAVALGEKYGIDGKTVQGWVTDMWRRDATRKDKLITDMRTEKEKTDKENLIKAQVTSALKRDAGLLSVKGNVRIVDEYGNEREVSAQEYGIRVLKEGEITNARSLIDAGKLRPEHAGAMVDKLVYEKLAKHGVVDTEHGREIEGALKGDFTADGKVSEGATKAFDFWLQMTKNPNVGSAYMAQMITDPDVRELLTTASIMYSGRMDIESALRKAHLRINQSDFKPDQRIVLNEKFQAQVGAGVDEAVANVMWPGWFSSSAFSEYDEASVATQRGALREDIINRANMYHVQNPMVDPEAHIKMAIEDFQNDAVVVSGKVILGRTSAGTRLDQVMGVESFGKDTPQRVLDSYMQEFGEDLFPNLYKERYESTASYLGNMAFDTSVPGAAWNALVGADAFRASRIVPNYHVEYNEANGTLEIQLWKDEKRKELIGEPQIVDAKEVGSYWLASNREPGAFFGTVRKATEALSTNIQNKKDTDAGALIGGMVK